jgi:predicted RNase H-like HicB family nuclease
LNALKDRYTYPALFAYENDCEGIGIVFPDLPGCVSHGDNEGDALHMAREALSLHLFGMEEDGDEIPEPTAIHDLNYDEYKSPGVYLVVVLVDVWMALFRERMNNKAVTKTVTLPRWLEVEAKAASLNYSQVLQDGLMERLGVQREIRGRRNHKVHA